MRFYFLCLTLGAVAGAGFVFGAFRALSSPGECRDQVAPVGALRGLTSCSHPDHWLSLVEVQSHGLIFCECRERK